MLIQFNMATVVKVEDLSKAYQIGQFGTGTLSRDIERWWALFKGNEDPYLKIGEKNNRNKKGVSDIVWSLNNLNFEIQEGEAVGIIGKNGAGKSTLLKILSQITKPTKGSVKMQGRVASLLEVGTGFHPELTGRENIFLNGAILGMRKDEIKRKFDEIVDFSGVERYIDTPVKRYSSGMYVRLAFAVAAYLESEILIVDEVLAVGDADFQKKCIGKMSDISKSNGRTILFVSHNISAINALCSNVIVLKDGEISYKGNTKEGIDNYLENGYHAKGFSNIENHKSTRWVQKKEFSKLISVETLNEQNERKTLFRMNENIKLRIELEIINHSSSLELGIFFNGNHESILSLCYSTFDNFKFTSIGKQKIQVELENINLFPSIYSIGIWVTNNKIVDDACETAIDIEIISNSEFDLNRFSDYGALLKGKWLNL